MKAGVCGVHARGPWSVGWRGRGRSWMERRGAGRRQEEVTSTEKFFSFLE